MPIDAKEKRWFDAMDGKRTIGDIVAGSFPSSPRESQLKAAREFIERLWWYDQVVVDASTQPEK